MANSFEEKYKKNIDGLATANKVDTGTAAAMLKSNLAGTTSYKGGGILDFNAANADLKNYLSGEAAKGSPGVGSSSESSNEDYLTRMARERERAQIAALKKSVDNAVSGYEEDIKNVPAQYQPMKDQTEVNRYTSEKALKESLANSGQMASGFGRTEQLNLHTGQNKELSSINAAEQTALDKLRLAIKQAREAQSQEELSITASSTASLMDNLYNERLRATAESKAEQAARAQAEAEANQNAFENWLKEQENDRANAETKYALGKPYYKASSGGSGSGSGSNLSESQAMTAWKAGIRTPSVVSAMQQHYGSSFAETAGIASEDTLAAIKSAAQSAMESVPAGTPQKQYVMVSAALKYLQNAVNTYQLTEAQAEKIARSMGINF